MRPERQRALSSSQDSENQACSVKRLCSRIGLWVAITAAVLTSGAVAALGQSYSYRRSITIDHTKVPNSDQSNFPVLISGTYSYLATTANGGRVQNSNGYDIIFTSDAAGSSKLDHEIESYNPATGAVNFWVRIPTLSHTTDTVIYLQYGNSAINTSQENKSGVWDANYKMVQHFPNGTTLSANDSTSNGNNGTINSAGATAGQIGGAGSFNGSSSSVTMPDSTSLDSLSNLTAEAWVEFNSVSTSQIFLGKGTGGDRTFQLAVAQDINGDLVGWLWYANGSFVTFDSGVKAVAGTWYHLVLTSDGSWGRIYVNGTLRYSSQWNQMVRTNSYELKLGDYESGGYDLNGVLDEVRLSNVARSADWIATEYNNQSSPSTFYTPGVENPPLILSLSPSSGRSGTSVTIQGASFGSSTGSVSFNGTSATVSSWSDTSITAVVPNSAGSGPVVVTNSSGVQGNGVNFTVVPVYGYRRAVVIDHTKVPNTDQSNFPVLITGTYSYLATVANGGRVQNAHGYDIIFTSDFAGLNQLDHEIESYDPATGTINFWVRVPTLSHATDTEIYMQYGSASVTVSQENKSGVWDANFQGVWHLSGSPLSGADSTSQGHNGTVNGATGTAGQIGGAGNFNGTSQDVVVGNMGSRPIRGTISMWIKAPALASNPNPFTTNFGGSGCGNTGIRFELDASGNLSVANGDQACNLTGALFTSAFTANLWHHLTLSWDSSANSETTYYDGVASQTVSNTLWPANFDAVTIGVGFNSSRYWNGQVDEVRISNAMRSADWVATEYSNHRSPSTFYSLSDENLVDITVSPTAATLYKGQTAQFGATVINASTTVVTWSVNPAGAGTVDSTGLYTAPATISSQQTVSVTATSVADTTRSASVTVTLMPPVAVTVTPATPSISPGQITQFTATVLNAPNTAVTWSLSPSGLGSLNNSGLYTAPAIISSQQTVTVTATSVADTTKTSSATVTLAPASAVYGYRRAISLDHTKVPNTDQTNFPVLISGVFGSLATTANGGRVQNANGYDIVFAPDLSGTSKLDHEIESYDPVTGTINFWVRIPVISHTADTVIYMWYGNAGVNVSQENRAGVWDSNYQGVWHLSNASSASINDSTINAANATNIHITAGAGQIAGAGSLDGSTAYAIQSTGSAVNIASDISVSFWMNPTSLANAFTVVHKGHQYTISVFPDGIAWADSSNYSYANFGHANIGIQAGVWQHIVATKSGGTVNIYRNGALSVSRSFGSAIVTGSLPLTFGAYNDGTPSPSLPGLLDEIRISNTARSGDWISTEYNNQSFPATFCSLSAENGPAITALSPLSAEPGASITISGSGFMSTAGTVSFNGQAATVSSWSDTSITAVVPLTSTSGPVAVTAGGAQSNAVGFTVLRPAITSLSPSAGDPGTAVVIQGANFDAAQGSGQVTFNGIGATVASWSAASITAYVPNGATTGNVVVTAPNGALSNSASFTVTDNSAITLLSPASGSVGTTVTIFGGGFGSAQGSSTLAFNGTLATVTSWSENQIVATVPPGTSTGPVTVTLGSGSKVWSPSPFVFTTSVQVTDSLSHSSSYTSAMQGGYWQGISANGSGCSSCTVRGNVQDNYDASGNLLSHIDELGHVTTYTYDSANNLASQSIRLNSTTMVTTSYTYNSFGEVLTMTDPLGNVTTNTYDSNGNLLTVTTPAPNGNTPASVTSFTYDSKGELTQITDPLNNITKLAYTPVGLISTITDAQNNVTTYQYDSHGNRTAVIDAQQNTTGFAYDSMERLTTITYPDHTTASLGYDYRGRRTTVTDQNGKITTYAYDDADRLTSVTDAASNVTQYSYDTENNLLSITDTNSNATSFAYDAFGRVTQTTFPSTFTESYTYDAAGNLTSKDDRKGQSILYVYDALNRLTHKGYPDSTGVDYIYDLAGKIKQVADPTGTYGFAYDNMGRLIGTTTQYAFLPSVAFTNSYAYDANSNRTSFTAPDGSTNSYQYDTLNRLNKLTSSLTGQFTFGYDILSRRTSLGRPNGVATSYSYDSLSRLLSVLHQNGTTTVDGASYTYDNAGNRTAKTNQLNGVNEQYTYDAIYQLLQVTQGATTTESYTYDSVGNRLSSLTVPSYSYNSSNELTSTSAATYTYDKNGNTLSKTASGSTTQYAWDFENRLTSVTLPGTGGTVNFKYDPFGRRIQKAFAQSLTTTTTNYVYDGANSVEEVDQNDNLLARYTQGAGIDEPLAELRSGTSSYYEQDGLGSVTSLSGSAGPVANTYVYDGFGNLTASTGSVVNPFQYTGRDYDSETGLRYYRARYYDANLGRLLSEDPLGFAEGIDLYPYVDNNPINAIDPLGLAAVPLPVPAPSPLVINLEGPAVVSLFLYELKLGGALFQTVQAINSENAAYAQQMQAESNLNQMLAQMNSGPYGSNVLNYISNQAKAKCQNNGCQPCIPPVGTISFRLDTTGRPHAGIPPPHWHLYIMQQDPSTCRCEWVKIKGNRGFGAGSPPSGTVPIGEASGGGRP